MRKRFISLLAYSLYWLGFFAFARLFFILFQHRTAFDSSITELAATFIHGLRLDVSTTGYFLILPVLVSIPGLYFNGNWYRIFMRWYSFLLILLSTIIIVGDAHLYSYWGFRMDYTPMFYLKTPGEAIASVTTLQAVNFVLAIVVMTIAACSLYVILAEPFLRKPERTGRYALWVPVMLLVTGALVIPIRGGFGIAPINAGSVYFSRTMFLNHAAVNAVWNVGTSAFTQKPVSNPYTFGDGERAAAVADSLYAPKGEPLLVLNTRTPNVLIIVLESFSGYLMGELGGDSLVTPNLNRYAREGILFTNFYASGTRTDKAIPAILSGYPALPAESIIKEPKKSQKLPNIVRMLIDKGYNSSFWYGGEIDFANFNSFIMGSGFRTIVTMDNFDPSDYNSKWGVHDHIMFHSLEDSMKNIREPFVSVVLTLSSHEPFDVPMEPVFKGSGNLVKYMNSLYYADQSLGQFLDQARQTGWWKNTLVIMVADHVCRTSQEIPMYSREAFRIPMVWTGGAVGTPGMRISRTGGQTDIAPTLLSQLGMNGDFPFGKDLLSPASRSFAFYAFNEGFGFITDSSSVAWDHKLGEPVMKEGEGAARCLADGKAYLQVLFDDYLKK